MENHSKTGTLTIDRAFNPNVQGPHLMPGGRFGPAGTASHKHEAEVARTVTVDRG